MESENILGLPTVYILFTYSLRNHTSDKTGSTESATAMDLDMSEKLEQEASDSWENYQQQQNKKSPENVASQRRKQEESPFHLRYLKKYEDSNEDEIGSDETPVMSKSHTDSTTRTNYLYQSLKARKKREKALNEMYRNPGIQDTTMHGMMVCYYSSLSYTVETINFLTDCTHCFILSPTRLMLDQQVVGCMSMSSIVEY